MTTRPLLLDLFCGAGGCSVGYHRAGFDVVGVDHRPQPRYPFRFVQGDALEYVAAHGTEFDAIHASPPCQGYSRLRHLPWLKDKTYPLLIEPCRNLLNRTGLPWVMENVEGAPLGGVVLCGQMFGLPVYRHRRFEASFLLMQPPHEKHREVIGAWGESKIVTVAGGQFKKADGERALAIDWMNKAELAQAIPPAFTDYVGRQLLQVVTGGTEP